MRWQGLVCTVDCLLPCLALQEAQCHSDAGDSRDHCDRVEKRREVEKQESMKRQNKNQIARFYNLGWHRRHAD